MNVKYDNGRKLSLKKFDVSKMVPNPSVVMIAKRGSGKSWVVRSILNYLKDRIPCGVIISQTEDLNSFYSDFFPSLYIYSRYSGDIFKNVLERQKLIKIKNERRIKKGKKPVDPNVFIIMDDCLASNGTWMKDNYVREVLFNGRHYNITYILTMQFSLGIVPELRGNFDYVFLLADDIFSNQERIYKHYAGIFPTFDAFRLVFRQVTNDFGSMVISNSNRNPNADLNEKVFWYKASSGDIPESIGCKQFLELHRKYFDKKWNKRKRKIDLCDIFRRKKKPDEIIYVEKER